MSIYFDTMIAGLRSSAQGASSVVSVEYRPAGVAANKLVPNPTGIWRQESQDHDYQPDSAQVKGLGTLMLDPDVVTSPSQDDTCVVAGIVYAVQSVKSFQGTVLLSLISRQVDAVTKGDGWVRR